MQLGGGAASQLGALFGIPVSAMNPQVQGSTFGLGDLAYDPVTQQWSSDSMKQQATQGSGFGAADQARYQALLDQAVAGNPAAVQKYKDALQQSSQQMPGGAASGLGGLGKFLTTPFEFDPSDLENTPGYQFTLQQGMKALNNQASAQGLGLSGAQNKGLLDYATGLADQTYGQQYARALQQFTANYGLASDQYNRLSGLAGLGQNAAAGVGNAGLQTGSNVANLLTGAANAQAAGTIGAANAINGGLSGLGNNALLYSLLGRGTGGATGGGLSSIYGSAGAGDLSGLGGFA